MTAMADTHARLFQEERRMFLQQLREEWVSVGKENLDGMGQRYGELLNDTARVEAAEPSFVRNKMSLSPGGHRFRNLL